MDTRHLYTVWNEGRAVAFVTRDKALAEAMVKGPAGMTQHMHLAEACRFVYLYGQGCTIEVLTHDGEKVEPRDDSQGLQAGDG